jgi:MraZ protein
MLLTGRYDRALDDKFRLALPKTFRDALATEKQLILTPGTDGSLSLFPGRAFSAYAEKLAARSPNGQDVRAYSRLLYAQSQTIEIDSQGRIRLSAELAELAQLEDAVVLIGVGDRVELWNKSRWEAYLAKLQPHYDELAESALSERATAPGRLPAADEAAVEYPATRPVQPR